MLWPYTSVYPAHAQSLGCVWLCDPMDCSPPGFSIHRTFQARIWTGSPFPSPGDLPDPAIKLASPALADRFFILSHLGSPCFCVYETIFYDNVYVEKTIIMRWPVTLFRLFKCWLWPSTLISWPHKIVLSDGTLWVWKCFVSVLSIIVPLVTCGHQALEMWLVWLRNWVFHFHIG